MVKAQRQGRLKGAEGKLMVSAEQMEIAQLRAELVRVTTERDGLGEATAYFAEGVVLMYAFRRHHRLGEKRARETQGPVGAAQFRYVALEFLDVLRFDRGTAIPSAGTNLVELDLVQQRLRAAAHSWRDRPHGCPQRPVLTAMLKHRAHRALTS